MYTEISIQVGTEKTSSSKSDVEVWKDKTIDKNCGSDIACDSSYFVGPVGSETYLGGLAANASGCFIVHCVVGLFSN